MKLLVDEMPVMSGDCPFFGYCDCKLDGNLCGLWRKEQHVDDKAECQCLTKFRPFTLETSFNAVFTKDHKLVKEEAYRGDWNINGTDGNIIGNWRCSACNGVSLKNSNYCPNCGAKMKGGAE